MSVVVCAFCLRSALVFPCCAVVNTTSVCAFYWWLLRFCRLFVCCLLASRDCCSET